MIKYWRKNNFYYLLYQLILYIVYYKLDFINLDLDNYYIEDYNKNKITSEDRENIIDNLLITNIDMILDVVLTKIHQYKSKKTISKKDFLYFDKLFKNSKEILNNLTKEGDTLLHCMVFFNCYDLVYLLIKNGAKIDIEDLDKQIPLHRTIFLSDNKILKLLIKKATDVSSYINYKDKDGNTPLHLAIIIKNYNIIHNLLKLGADPYIMNNAQLIPLDLAKENKDFDLKIIQIFKNFIK